MVSQYFSFESICENKSDLAYPLGLKDLWITQTTLEILI